jgi:SAM-dependent methyltransferase
MQKTEDKVLESQGLAALTFTLQWSDGRAGHEDEMHFETFSVWREADFLPAEIGGKLVGMRAGDSAHAALPAGDVTGAWDATREVSGSPSRFDRAYRRGLVIEPRYGRFYPQGIFHGLQGIVREALEPARITALDDQTMRVDLNHPLARFPFRVACRVDRVLPGYDKRGGRCSSPLDDLLRHPGFAAPVQEGLDTSFGDDEHGMARMDEREDKLFYSNSRLVQHLDARALETVNALYARLLPGEADVLDLATARVVQDLNLESTLPFEDASLDAVVCTASVEYLVQPRRVFAEVLRVLRPGGVFVSTFSNRWFPTKAIRIWGELHEFERVGMVTQWLRQAGFDRLHTFSSRGWPRPQGDPHSCETAGSDPVYAAWGFKSAG